MGKQRQRKRTPKRRTNPIQRRIEQGVKEGSSQLPPPTAEQVTPVVERVKTNISLFYCDLCMLIFFFSLKK